jgi:glycerol kinase
MFPPRFVLVLSAESNLLRASLVTRELKSVASARQSFQVTPIENGTQEFDPAEVWYLAKKVIAACLDIGRTLSREVAGVAIVCQANTFVSWSQQADEVVSSGRIGQRNDAHIKTRSDLISEQDGALSGTLATWLWWYLTGAAVAQDENGFSKTRARAPFDAELPIVTVLEIDKEPLSTNVAQGSVEVDWNQRAAESAWRKLEGLTNQEFGKVLPS